jgi:hypothetical protein
VSSYRRFVFLPLNLAWGASIGAAAGLLVHRADAWSNGPSGALLAVGCGVVFGAAYAVTASARGQRPTALGALTVCVSAAVVLGLWTLAVAAPGWVLVWALAGLAGVTAGLVRPLPRTASEAPRSTPDRRPADRPRGRRRRRAIAGA